MECSNFNCGAHTWNSHVRCANCRRADINMCCDCDEPCSRRALYCTSCRDNHRASTIKSFYDKRKGGYPECQMCFKELPKRHMKRCLTGDCKRIYTNLDQVVRRGNKYITN